MHAQSPTCYSSPDGIEGSGWSYKDYIIPTGYRIDSVRMSASRPGYGASDHDFVFQSCSGTTIYNAGIATAPFDYSTINTSLYNTWIDLTTFNYSSVGMVRVALPTNTDAIWDDLCFALSSVNDCYTSADGTDGSGWSIKDYIIPAGFQLDSVYMDASRPGFATSDEDFVFQWCSGSTTYNAGTAVSAFDFNTETNSLYNSWIDLTSMNITSVAMARVALPTNAGAIWNQVCFAISPTITTGIRNEELTSMSLYPNPAHNTLQIGVNSFSTCTIINAAGQTISTAYNTSGVIDISSLPAGMYILKVYDTIKNASTTAKFIKH